MKITTGIKNTVRAGITGAKKAKSVLSTKKSFMIAGVVAGIIGSQICQDYTTHANEILVNEAYAQLLKKREEARMNVENIEGKQMISVLVAPRSNIKQTEVVFIPLKSVNSYLEPDSAEENSRQYVHNGAKWDLWSVTFATYTEHSKKEGYRNDIIFQRNRLDLLEDADDYKSLPIKNPEDSTENSNEEYTILATYNPYEWEVKDQYRFFNPVIHSKINDIYEESTTRIQEKVDEIKQ